MLELAIVFALLSVQGGQHGLHHEAFKSNRVHFIADMPTWAPNTYQWISDSEIFYYKSKILMSYDAYILNTISSKSTLLQRLNARCNSYFFGSTPLISQDGKWMVSARRPPAANGISWFAASIDGKEVRVSPEQVYFTGEISPSLGAWIKGSTKWVRLTGSSNMISIIIFDIEKPDEVITKPLSNADFKQPEIWTAPSLLGCNSQGEAVAMWVLPEGKPRATILQFDPLRPAPAAKRFEVQLPRGVRVDSYALSPQGTTIAWAFSFARYHKSHKIQHRTEIWTSNANGSDLHRVLSKTLHSSNYAGEEFIGDIRWSPAVPKISFSFNNGLYCIDLKSDQ